jgi:S-methylmethionine-dependent homocysteine/selenocysteine methylase
MVVLALLVINKSGGLIYHKYLTPVTSLLSTNELLRIGSTFHGLDAIISQVAPVVSSGINCIETDTYVLKCLHTLTGNITISYIPLNISQT